MIIIYHMKKLIHFFPLLLLAGLLSCSKDGYVATSPVDGGARFTIITTIDTKTVNNGISTQWASTDRINVFHKKSEDSDFVSDGRFDIEDIETGKFSGNLAEELDKSSNYDWFVSYPYQSGNSFNNMNVTIGGTKTVAQLQQGNSSMSHLAGNYFPLYAHKQGVEATSSISIPLKNLAAVIEFEVTNKLETSLQVTSIMLLANEKIIGAFQVDYSQSPIVFTAGNSKSIARLNVQDGEMIPTGATEKFYIGVKPHTIKTGDKLAFRVYTSDGTRNGFQLYEKTIESDLMIGSGSINCFKVDYTSAIGAPLNVTKADLETLNDGDASTTFKEYSTYDGWVLKNGNVRDHAVWDAITSLCATINGRTSAVGTLTSPLLAGGCGTLSFKYGLTYSGDKLSFKIDFLNEAGEIVKTVTVTEDSAEQFQQFNFSQEINLSGPFSMVFTNLSPSGSKSVKDRVSLFDIEWTNYSE